jgi:hypothetical protein
MIKDCIAEEYKLFSFPASDLANRIMSLRNSGYNVEVHYSAGNVGSALIVATLEEEEKPKAKTKGKAKEAANVVDEVADKAEKDKASKK